MRIIQIISNNKAIYGLDDKGDVYYLKEETETKKEEIKTKRNIVNNKEEMITYHKWKKFMPSQLHAYEYEKEVINLPF
jgi:formyltetrahydrofolate hydrolase